jgi:sortase (surface protein transpeptidase)
MPTLVTFLLVALSIMPLPSNFATSHDNAVTLFKTAYNDGTTALIAHNNLGGRYFGGLDKGDQIVLTYPDRKQVYEVDSILRYEAVTLWAYRVDVGESHIFSDVEVYNFIYHAHDGRLVLQTCYDGSNGRLFIIAYPKD